MPDLELRIREYREDDIGKLYEIDGICFPADIAFSREELGLYLNYPESIVRLAEGFGMVLGFVLARIENRSRAHVITLDVVPEARQNRIGTTLMNQLHNELRRRNVSVSFLEVGINNLPAQRLYEGLQYQYLNTLPGYYHGREDAYRMARLLTPANP
jgi:ribosomal protein S18 acetylase RimI-like enzyme